MKVKHRGNYTQARKEAYPSIGDQLDAIWKALEGHNLPPETAAMYDRIQTVKSRIPKPE